MKTNFLHKSLKFLFLAALCFISYNSFAGPAPSANGFMPNLIKKSLSREFKENKEIKTYSNFVNYRNNHNYKGGILLGLTEMQQIYLNSDTEYNFTEKGVSYTMDIKNVDLVNAQTWVMPDFNFVDYEIGENADVSSSPYFSSFPTATHLQYYDYSEWDEYYYEYYQFSSDKIEIIGGVDVFAGEVDIEPMSYIVTPLPLDINTDFSSDEQFTLNDTTYHFVQHIYTEGYGTIETPHGTFNCLKIANDFYADEYVGGELIADLETYLYTFYCENGYRLNLYLSEDETTYTGVVDIDFVDLEIPSAITSVKEISEKSDFCYPNPATDILNFQEIGNYQIYNSLGVMVLNLKNIQNTDISSLNSGIYFIKSEKGKIQKIIINN